MRTTTVTLTAATALLTLTACGPFGQEGDEEAAAGEPAVEATPVGVILVDSELGEVLADQEGRILYGFTKDKDAESVCEGDCIATWPALTASAGAVLGEGLDEALLDTTERTDGITQITYGEWPLYYYVGDALPEETNGQGLDDEWFVIATDGSLIRE
ncbi:COG4315 family predicted lipoprotein [Nocardiopsis valliformis]|uniref:COG4315 family predicted lipoprotein n=1 Tax=Nocardiopsis valliformis TaxID=239974 RepID=UPI00058524EC|nr:hypothetical protein [Nocardiopsis valliformis]